jgi:hypothetical protein
MWDALSRNAPGRVDVTHGVSVTGENLAAMVPQVGAHRPPKGYGLCR